jgi:hypothetical protein
MVVFSAIGGSVVLVASAFHCAKSSAAFALLEVLSIVAVALPALLFLEVSAGSEPMLPAGCIFLLAVERIGRGENETFISSKTRLTRPWCFKIFWVHSQSAKKISKHDTLS